MSDPGSATTAAGDGSTSAEGSTEAGPEAKPDPSPARRSRWAENHWWVRHYTFTGTAVGLIFIFFSMTPSLLPRGALFQGLVSGSSGASGYGLGVFAVWLVQYMRMKDSSPPPPRWAWLVLIPLGVVGMVLMAIWFHVWQDQVRDLMGVEHLKWYDYPFAAVLSVVVLFTLVEIGQFVRKIVRFLVGQVDRIAPFRLSATIVVVLLAVLTVTVLNGVVLKFAMRTMNNTFESVNDEMTPNSSRQNTQLRSEGPGVICVVGVVGPPGPNLCKGRPERRETHRIQRSPGRRADPGLRGPELGEGHHVDRGIGGP